MKRKCRTGIFLPYFEGERLRDFPLALDNVLNQDNVHYYDGVYGSENSKYYLQPVKKEILSAVHSEEMINSVRRSGFFETALYSAGGTVQAAEEIFRGIIDNAFVFTGVGDHHAGRNFFGGMCYFNGAAIAIAALRKKGCKRFVIVDTDSHHADGTRDIFGLDHDVLHICFCHQDYGDDKGNMDILIPYGTTDEYCLEKVERALIPGINSHQPEFIFWEFGYDATRGEYGDKGLSKDCHLEIVKIIKSIADHVCQGRLITILCGGSGRQLATYTIPRIVAHMAEA